MVKLALYQGGKRNPNPNFLVRIFSSGVGVFHVNGWGPKSSIRPSKPGKSNFLGGISRDFAGISRGRPKSLRKKVWVQFSFPTIIHRLSCKSAFHRLVKQVRQQLDDLTSLSSPQWHQYIIFMKKECPNSLTKQKSIAHLLSSGMGQAVSQTCCF